MNANESVRMLKRGIAVSRTIGHHPHNLTCGTYSRWHLVCPVCGCVGTASERGNDTAPDARECVKCGTVCDVIDIKEEGR